MYKGKIPFDPKTDQPMYYAQNGYAFVYDGITYDTWREIEVLFGTKAVKRINIPPIWKDNKPFLATITIKSISRGRSAANFNVEDENGTEYTMFMKDLLNLLLAVTITEGRVENLLWCFCKRGENYGIQLFNG